MSLPPSDEHEIKQIVHNYAKRYARRCWWADERDLQQVGWVGVQIARRKYDPAKGKVGPYFGRAVRRAITNFLIRESCPASSSWHDRFKTIGMIRVSEDNPDAIAAFEGEDEGWADRILDDRRRRVRLLARLYEVVGADGRAGLDALLGQKKQRGGQMSGALRRSIALAWGRIAGDDELRRLWDGTE